MIKRVICPNCSYQVIPDPVKECGSAWPLEAMVEEDDSFRERQYDAAMAGLPYRHSVNMASSYPPIAVQP